MSEHKLWAQVPVFARISSRGHYEEFSQELPTWENPTHSMVPQTKRNHRGGTKVVNHPLKQKKLWRFAIDRQVFPFFSFFGRAINV